MENFNKFLRDFADKWYLFIVFCVVFFAWLHYQNDFLAQLARDLVMAMLAIAGFKRVTQETATTNIDADTIKTPNVNTETMPNAQINLAPKTASVNEATQEIQQ